MAQNKFGLTFDRKFPKDWWWGSSTCGYQIEGAVNEDGRGKSIWDTYTEQGNIQDGSNAYVACDHYHRYPEDIALMVEAGFNTYRFSFAWPRVIPDGTGAVNEKGLDYYDRMIDAVLEKGIKAIPCLYHWDLPQTLQDKNGWLGREVLGPFERYAEVLAKRFGDRLDTWMMLNEPNIVAICGHGVAEHAPGLRAGEEGILRVLHHENVASGMAMRAIKSIIPNVKLGTVTNLSPCVPDTDKPEDILAAKLWDAAWNRVTLDGLFKGEIPECVRPWMEKFVQPGDLEIAKNHVDFLGINYYGRNVMKHEEGRPFNAGWGDPKAKDYTDMGWGWTPDSLYDQLIQLRDDYGNPAMFIAENGAAYNDVVEANGEIHDAKRAQFIKEHIEICHRALTDGVNMKGYLVWSLLDNFEWAFGLSKRFGIVRVDYDTLKRTKKDSYYMMQAIAKANAV